MSTTLLSSFPLPRNNPKIHVQLPVSQDELDASQFARLASQHHNSEYNRIKFGPQGCPVRYIPLSIHLPDQFKELLIRQMECKEPQSWWPCITDNLEPLKNHPVIVLGPCGAPNPINVQKELSTAIAESLSTRIPRPPPRRSRQLKTSATHPINISSLIPPELLPLISSHLLMSFTPPTIFETNPSFRLDRLALSHQQPYPRSHPVPSAPPLPVPFVIGHLRTRSSVTEALQAAINSTINSPACPPLICTNTNPPSVSALPRSNPKPPHPVMPASSNLCPPKHPRSAPPTVSEFIFAKVDRLDEKICSHAPVHAGPAPNTSPLTPFLIGNMFLSSCPGKKVRLQGPTRGRTGVCRDLAMDMQRIKELGVGCIVCCLDNAELEFLGAPWLNYSSAAKTAGIDILRIPIPEGLAPPTPAVLDARLAELIDRYTLHGVPVLVHCRGGVGRAGVFACCWVAKLGLCGWWDAAMGETALGFVESVIGLVRRRRSVKAVETYEQVKFLVEYMQYLDERQNKEGPDMMYIDDTQLFYEGALAWEATYITI
ncbi:protein-tyrosine phosphatase-like protein [Infundibulicybe gibba]|nr:protein-tyrosine phosphatase-like protein [Infundibulicybe gibba]